MDTCVTDCTIVKGDYVCDGYIFVIGYLACRFGEVRMPIYADIGLLALQRGTLMRWLLLLWCIGAWCGAFLLRGTDSASVDTLIHLHRNNHS